MIVPPDSVAGKPNPISLIAGYFFSSDSISVSKLSGRTTEMDLAKLSTESPYKFRTTKKAVSGPSFSKVYIILSLIHN